MSEAEPAKSLTAQDLRSLFRGRPLVIGRMNVSRATSGAYLVEGAVLVNEENTERGFSYTIAPDGVTILHKTIAPAPRPDFQ